MIRKLIFILLITAALVSCSSPEPVTLVDEPERVQFVARPTNLETLEMGLDALSAFESVFTMTFNGDRRWVYQLVTRRNATATEYSLHIEGVSVAYNPGDLRLVNQGGVNRMSGPATGNVCVQFPDGYPAGVLFLSPSDLVWVDQFESGPIRAGSDRLLGQSVTLYEASQEGLKGWSEAQINYAQDDENDTVLRYTFTASGFDPLFNAGEGVMTGEFEVTEIAAQGILPVEGCEVKYPLPQDVSGLIKLPDLISFNSQMSPEEFMEFYHSALLNDGWLRLALPKTSVSGDVFLSYVLGDETLNVNIEPTETGIFVELFSNPR